MKLKYLLIVVCLFCFYASLVDTVSAAEKMSRKAERQFGAISTLLEKADQHLESGESEEATKLYGATIAAYQEFSSKYPEANQEMVKFRVAYCRNQLISLLATKRAVEKQKESKADDDKKAKESPDLTKVIVANIELCRKGHYDEVESAMRGLIKKNPDCSEAYLLLGTACIGNGDLDHAMKLLKKAIKVDPSNRDAHYNLCQLLIRLDEPDFEEAATHYRIAVELGADPDVDLETVLNL